MLKLFRAWVPLCSLLLVATVSCEGSHGDLAATGGAGGNTSSSSTSSSSSGGGGGSAGAPPVVEPDLPDKLTLINGSPDRSELQFCFVDSATRSGGVLLPPQPLAFGHSFPIVEPAAVLTVESELEAIVVAGDLEQVVGTSCADLLLDPPVGVDVVSLGLLPSNTFAQQRSLAFVVTGCFGAADAEDAELGCGDGYTGTTPTLFPIIAPLSRLTEPSAVGLAVLNASSSFEPVDVRIQPNMKSAPKFPLASQVPRGGTLPFPPYIALNAATLGAPNGVKLFANRLGQSLEVEVVLGPALSAGGLSSLDNGASYVFVAVGAAPAAPEGFWEPFSFVVVEADPK